MLLNVCGCGIATLAENVVSQGRGVCARPIESLSAPDAERTPDSLWKVHSDILGTIIEAHQ
jgi:hypothetical protein